MKNTWLKFLPSFIRDKLEGRSTLQDVIANTSWLFLDQILRMGIGVFVGIWLARYLGPEQFGIFSYAMAFAILFSPIASLGLSAIVVRNIVSEPDSVNEILGSAFLLKLLSGALTLVLAIGIVSYMHPNDALTRWLVGIIAAGMVFQSFDVIDFWFQSQVRSKYVVYAKSSAFLMASIGKVALILTGADLIAFAWIGLFEMAAGAVFLLVAYKLKGPGKGIWHGRIRIAGKLLKDSWPLILSGVASMIYLRIDQVMLNEMVSSSEVGIYSVAVRIAEVWHFVPVVICSSVFPSIVDAKMISEKLFYERLQKLYNIMAFTAYFVAIPTIFMAEWLVEILYGSAYSKAGPMLIVLIWTVLFVNLGVARSNFLMTMNWTGVHFMTVALGAITNIVLNYILIPRYGGLGASIASCIAYWVAAHGACFFYKPLHKTGLQLTKAMVYPRIW